MPRATRGSRGGSESGPGRRPGRVHSDRRERTPGRRGRRRARRSRARCCPRRAGPGETSGSGSTRIRPPVRGHGPARARTEGGKISSMARRRYAKISSSCRRTPRRWTRRPSAPKGSAYSTRSSIRTLPFPGEKRWVWTQHGVRALLLDVLKLERGAPERDAGDPAEPEDEPADAVLDAASLAQRRRRRTVDPEPQPGRRDPREVRRIARKRRRPLPARRRSRGPARGRAPREGIPASFVRGRVSSSRRKDSCPVTEVLIAPSRVGAALAAARGRGQAPPLRPAAVWRLPLRRTRGGASGRRGEA